MTGRGARLGPTRCWPHRRDRVRQTARPRARHRRRAPHAPGRRASGEPFVLARVFDGAGAAIAEAVGQTEAAAERRGAGPDTRVLAELARTGTGLFDPAPTATLRSDGPLGTEPVATWPYLLLAAAALVGIDLWLRRFRRPHRPAAAARSEVVAVPPVPLPARAA